MSYAIYQIKKLYPDGIVKDLVSHKSLYQYAISERKSSGYSDLSEYLKAYNLTYIRNPKKTYSESDIVQDLNNLYPNKIINNLNQNNKLYGIIRTAAQESEKDISEYLSDLGYIYQKNYNYSEFDCNTVKRLQGELKFSLEKLSKLIGISRERVRQKIKQEVTNANWNITELTEDEKELFMLMIDDHLFYFTIDDNELIIVNDLHENICLILKNDNNIKCMFKEFIPNDMLIAIHQERMDIFDELDIDIYDNCSTVSVMKKIYLNACDSKYKTNITKATYSRHKFKSKNDYGIFLGYSGCKSNNDRTDDIFYEFFENNLIDGEVYISSNKKNQWIRDYASRDAKMSLNEFIQFYGYKKASRKFEDEFELIFN